MNPAEMPCCFTACSSELRKSLSGSKRKTDLTNWLNDDLLIRFSGYILPIDAPVMIQWGHLTAVLETRGKAMSAIDSLIAAVALYNGLSLVTRNEKDFEHTGIMMINPWTAP